MNKLILIILAILLISPVTFAQKKKAPKPERIFAGISIGPGFPENDFKSTEITPSSGYAKTGYKIAAYGGFNIIGGVGIAIMGFTNVNKTDAEQLKLELEHNYPGNSFTVSSDYWHLYGGMGGISFYYPVSKKVTLDLKVMSGMLSSNSPEFLFVSGSNSVKIESKNASAFSYLTSVGLNFDVGQNISLTGSFDFMSSHPNFTDVKTTTVINENTTESVQSFSREMELISVTIGFRYSFRW